MWFGIPDSARYEKLQVLKLPYNAAGAAAGPYLLSPIGQEIRMKFSAATDTGRIRHKKIYPYEDFGRLVLEDGEFNAMLEWVSQNQVNKKKYSTEELREEYRKFISDIYTKYLYREEGEV